MKTFINKPWIIKYGRKLMVIFFWLLLWELLSRWIGHAMLLPSPIGVFGALIEFGATVDFWCAIIFSSLRIILGFFLALLIGTMLAVIAYKSKLIKELLTPLIKMIQAMPVASFIILALIWIKAKNLSVLISFLMVMPLIFTNMIKGLETTDEKLLEMAKVFQVSKRKQIRAIYIPAIKPHFIAAISVGMGFCWKAGIAAEVIGIPAGSIGANLYEAKLYLMTKELFAWTVVIIVISIIFEKAVMLLLQIPQRQAFQRKLRDK